MWFLRTWIRTWLYQHETLKAALLQEQTNHWNLVSLLIVISAGRCTDILSYRGITMIPVKQYCNFIKPVHRILTKRN